MIRRVFALLGGGAALLTLASCSTFETDNAATVNGTDISVDTVNTVRASMAADPATWGFSEDSLDPAGEVDGDLTRQLLSILIQTAVLDDALDHAGVAVTDAQRADAEASIASQIPDAPADVQAVFVDGQAASTAVSALTAPDPASLEAEYEQRPASTGIVCLRVATSASEDEAAAARVAFEEGADVAPTATMSVEDRCLLLVTSDQTGDSLGSSFPDQAESLLSATPGTILPIVSRSTSASGSGSWQAVQVIHWDDAAEPFAQLLAQHPAEAAVGGAYARAQVTVASEYGKWDPLSGSVVALTPAEDGAA